MVASTNFVHLTDTHFMPRPGDREHGIDPAANLRGVMAKIGAMESRPACVVISGDLSNQGDPASYEHFRVALAELDAAFGVPVLLALGNHDRRIPFRQIILGEADAADVGARYYYSRRIGDLRFLVLDSLIPGAIEGALGAEQLAWLAGQLDDPAPGGEIIVVHHPVVPRGDPSAHEYNLLDAAELGAVIAGHRVLGVLGGHSHHASAALFAGTVAITAPAAGFFFGTGPDGALTFIDGAGFNACTVRDGGLIVRPVILPGMQEEH